MRRRCLIVSLCMWLACLLPSPLLAQDTLTRVRELYLAADYESALVLLDHLEAPDRRPEILVYRVFCLLALERGDEARDAIKAIVEADPFHHLAEGQTSPRMQTIFEETRKALLPGVVQQMYADAKASFDAHDPEATNKFDRLLTLLDDQDLRGTQVLDLRAVIAGFRDLIRKKETEKKTAVAVSTDPPAALTPVPEPVAEPKPAPPLSGPPDKFRVSARGASPIFTPKDPPPPGLELPLALSQVIPAFSARGKAAQQASSGLLEITIDEEGSVTMVTLQQSVEPNFDKALLKAARGWKFTPARLNGTPVVFIKLIEIQVQLDR